MRLAASHLRIAALVLVAAALATTSAAYALGGAGAAAPAPTAKQTEAAKKLYRKYCGQCHALRDARAVGFGSDKGLGVDGGPSFNTLRVPFYLSVVLVAQRSAGHEHLPKKLTFAQIKRVAEYVARVTKDHPVQALPVDG